jgi:two-component system chemotaxis response regulator CheB
VVVVSSLTTRNSEPAVRALALGAVEVIAKPGSAFSTQGIVSDLARAVRTAARARVARAPESPAAPLAPVPARGAVAFAPTDDDHLALDRGPGGPLLETTHKVLAIGASTGGTQAIEHVLRALPPNTPGTVIVQHMPEHFTAAFANRLNGLCAMDVREARDGDPVVPGVALIAPGNKHLVLQLSGARYHARIKDGPQVHHQRPAVDVLFQSVARHAGRNAVGVLLTGMGADGAKGMLAMREAGAHTIAQDEQSCVVFGMPKEAIKLGAAAEVQALTQMPRAVLGALGRIRGEALAAV